MWQYNQSLANVVDCGKRLGCRGFLWVREPVREEVEHEGESR